MPRRLLGLTALLLKEDLGEMVDPITKSMMLL